MSDNGSPRYEFGEFRIDLSDRSLKFRGEHVPLAPKVFDTLAILVERHGTIVPKQEIIDTLWPDAFVEESNLSQNIYTLRRVLEKGGNGKQLIVNVPRRGYRFDGTISNPDQVVSDVEPLPPAPRGSRFAWLGVAVLAIALTAIGAYFFLKPTTSQLQTLGTAPSETVNLRRLTYTGDIRFPILAPDGASFAYVRGNEIVVQDIASGTEMELAIEGHQRFGPLQFSADSSTIYFRDQASISRSGDLYKVSRFGGRPEIVVRDAWSGAGFTPDGGQMAYIRERPAESSAEVVVRSMQTGVERVVHSVTSPANYLVDGYPAWSTDGKKIAVVLFDRVRTSVQARLGIIEADTGGFRELDLAKLKQVEQVVWLNGDNELLVAAREPAAFFQLWRFELASGTARKITNDLSIYRGVSLSADGSKLLARQYTLFSHIWTAASDNLENPVQHTTGNLNRDGTRGLHVMQNGDIVYDSRVTGNDDLWFLRGADASRTQLTKNSGESNQYPFPTQDGKHVYFTSNRSGPFHIWRMNADGSDQVQVTFGEKDIELYPQVSDDGGWLYFIRRGSGGAAVVRQELSSGTAENLTDRSLAPDNFLILSPDEKSLAFHTPTEAATDGNDDSKVYSIAILPIGSPGDVRVVKIAATRLAVEWSPDGTALDYVENDDQAARIWRQPIDGPERTLIATYPKLFLHDFTWSSNGTRLALSLGKQLNDAVLLTEF